MDDSGIFLTRARDSLSRLAGKRVLAALSGGSDSVALLVLLRDVGACAALSAAHFNHHIRGAASDMDAAFCRELCAEAGVPYFEGNADVPLEAARAGEGLETAARRLRYQFLRRAMAESGAELIALAHHADDQAETLLMHLLRGAGPAGMVGMEEFSGDLARPLLWARRAELRGYLRERGVSWREDETNREADNPRNFLRLRAMPMLETAYPGAVGALCRHAELEAAENAFMERQVQALLSERARRFGGGWRLDLKKAWDEALLRRAVKRLIGPGADAAGVLRACRAARGEAGAAEISGGVRAERGGDALYLLQKRDRILGEAPLCPDGVTRLAGIGRMEAHPTFREVIRQGGLRQVLSMEALSGAVLRTRRDGDRIRPLGMTGTKSLSDYLIDRGVDRPLRDWIPLLARGGNVLWAVGVGVSEDAAVRDEAARLELQFTREEEP